MFRGNQPARVDEKGRLKVPAAFKRIIDEQSYGPLFFITSQDGQRAEIYPLQRWEKIEEEVRDKPWSEAKQKWLDVTGYYGQEVEMDAQGRLLIPQLLRQDATLSGDVAVLGFQRSLTVVNEAMHRARLAANPVSPLDRDALGLVEL